MSFRGLKFFCMLCIGRRILKQVCARGAAKTALHATVLYEWRPTCVTEWLYDDLGSVQLHVLPTEKYKMVSVLAQLERPLQRERVTATALLPQVLLRGTEQYDTQGKLLRAFDDLYGARVGARVNKHGDLQTVEFTMQVPHEAFIEGSGQLFGEAIRLFAQVITAPKVENAAFRESYVEGEKVLHQQRIENLVNDKVSYASERCVQEMCGSEPYGLSRLGYLEDVAQIDASSLYHTYQRLLQESFLHVYVVGPVDPVNVGAILRRELTADAGPRNLRGSAATASVAAGKESDTATRPLAKERVVVERLDVNQGKLNLGLRTGSSYAADDYPALIVYNGILGGFPHSKLFANVREKASLAYYASSRLEGLKGLLFIQSGIQIGDYERARTIIGEQLEALADGAITDDELAFTQEGLVNQYLQSDDQPFTGAVMQMYKRFTGRDRSVPQLIDEVRKVTKKDVVAVAQTVKVDTVYFLRDRGV